MCRSLSVWLHFATATVSMQLMMLKSAKHCGLRVYGAVMRVYGIICRGQSQQFLDEFENCEFQATSCVIMFGSHVFRSREKFLIMFKCCRDPYNNQIILFETIANSLVFVLHLHECYHFSVLSWAIRVRTCECIAKSLKVQIMWYEAGAAETGGERRVLFCWLLALPYHYIAWSLLWNSSLSCAFRR